MTDLFSDEDPFGLPAPEPAGEPPAANAPPEWTVGELSLRLKQTVEGAFSFVRVRGEISRVTVAKSGHMYTSLKDADAVLDAVCWRGTMARLGIRPEEGMEVVCTGRLTTYPGRSNYQLVIETMELAGQGALLKMLEERRKKLAAEGLFDPARKRKIPFLPDVIGVVTSPTGAVIRDIVHRISERFPRRIVVWPVAVQGQGAAAAVAAAIRGFNALDADSPHRPDVIIVARGGGSLEDLMPFNDEQVVRAAAESRIPLISAVGHETDTTLIDHAADLRAPTPTGAAEKAVPVRADLVAQVMDSGGRLFHALRRLLSHHATRVEGLARGLGDPRRFTETLAQKLDHLAARLESGPAVWLERRTARLKELTARISARPLLQKIENGLRLLAGAGERLSNTEDKVLKDRRRALDGLAALLESLSFKRVLERGYAVVAGADGRILSSAKALSPGQRVALRFRDGERKAEVAE